MIGQGTLGNGEQKAWIFQTDHQYQNEVHHYIGNTYTGGDRKFF